MYVTRSVEIFIRSTQVVELPKDSELIAVRRLLSKGASIFVDFVFDDPADGAILREKRKFFIAQLGAEMPEYNPDWYHIGSVTFENDLVFHVWDAGAMEDE